MRLQGAVTAVALASALLLTACTADPPPATPTGEPTATQSTPAPSPTNDAPTPEPSPTPTLADVSVTPKPPAALKGPANADNAVEVAEYFLSLFPYGFATGDTAAWEDLSGSDCRYCHDIIKGVAHDHAEGWHDIGGDVEFVGSHAADLGEGSFYVTIVFNEHPSKKLDSQGHVVKDFPGTITNRAKVYLIWSEKRWVVDGVDVDQVEDQA